MPSFDNTRMDVSEVVAFMANASLAEELVSVDAPARARAAQLWLFSQSEADAIDDTVDMGANGEDDE